MMVAEVFVCGSPQESLRAPRVQDQADWTISVAQLLADAIRRDQ